VKDIGHKAPSYVVSSTPVTSSPYLPQHSILEPQCARQSFTPIQNYSSVYFNLYIFVQQTGTQKTLYRMIASIP